MTPIGRVHYAAATILLLIITQITFAQSFSTDARRIGMGGAGDSDTAASRLIEQNQPYRVIPVPLGLFQLWDNRRFFDPDDAEFDPVRALEYATNPLHFTLDRNADSAGNRFVNNLVNSQLSRDLNAYRGFSPSPEIRAAGLISPSWGKAFRVKGDDSSPATHGVYVGAGPYLALGTRMTIDQALIDVLASETDVYRPDSQFLIGDVTSGQFAGAITGGYRGRFNVAGFEGASTTGRQAGLHVAVDTHYLRGFHYEEGDMALRIDTDSQGLVTVQPNTTPIVVQRSTSKSGNGFALDVATALVAENWDVSVGIDGIGNRINWKDLTGRQYALQTLYTGVDFTTVPTPAPPSPRKVTLPIRVAGGASYYTDRWSAAAEIGRDLNERVRMNAGGEYWFGRLALRGGVRHSRDLWHGATGLGFNITSKFGVDVAMFQNSGNLEEDRKPSFAVSLRLNRDSQ
jgi:hypothetical protein